MDKMLFFQRRWTFMTKILNPACVVQKSQRSNSQFLHNKFPFLEIKSARRIGACIVDQQLAVNIAKSLGADKHRDNGTIWLEVNPGPGYLSEALLKAGVQNLIAVECRKEFIPYLKELKKKFNDFVYHQRDFFNRGALQKDVHVFVREVIPNLKVHSFNEAPPLKIVVCPGISHERKLVKTILNQLISSSLSLFSYGRIEFIMLVSTFEKQRLMINWPVKPFMYRERTALFNLMFDVEFLLEIDPDGIFPKQISSNYKRKNKQNQVTDSLHVVRITPKEGLFTTLFAQQELPMFAFFVKEMLTRRSQRLIPKLEVYFPGCGLQMIDAGYTMDQITGNISPEGFVELFKMVMSWPGFEESNFISLYRRFQGEHISDIEVS